MTGDDLSRALDQEADALLASLGHDLFSQNGGEDTSEVDAQGEAGIPTHIPGEVVSFVRGIARSERTLALILGEADQAICRRLGGGDSSRRRAMRWQVAWQRQPERLQRFLRRLRDQYVFAAHLSLADSAKFRTPEKLPKNLVPWRPNEAGILVIDDPVQVQPSFGSPAFLEATPMKVVRYVYETWRERHLESTEGALCPAAFRKPKAWDLTAGSGTVGDYLGTVLKCTVIESDLTPVRDHIDCASALRLGTIGSHTGFGGLAVVHRFVQHPDLVFFDPPSRGTPSASHVYYGGFNGQDLAELPRHEWIETVALVSRAATAWLPAKGLVSVLVRHGHRRSGRVTPDIELLERVKEGLAKPWEGLPCVVIVSELPLEFRGRRAQMSLGKERVPATHLLLARAE